MTLPIVANLGLCRTGTSSLRQAMGQLGWTCQEDPYQRTRLELLFAGKAREAMDRDIASGFTFLSEPYYAFAPAVLQALRPGETPLVTVRAGKPWLASMRKRAAKAPYSPVPPWMPVPFSPSQQMLLWLWRQRKPSVGAASRAWRSSTELVERGIPGLELCDPRLTSRDRWAGLLALLRQFAGWEVGPAEFPTVPFPHVNAGGS